MKAVLMNVRGKVQGVAFRYSTREKALNLNLVGWVRNRKNGSVEIYVQGAEENVDQMEKWAQAGPPAAKVKNVITMPKPYEERMQGFIVRPTC